MSNKIVLRGGLLLLTAKCVSARWLIEQGSVHAVTILRATSTALGRGFGYSLGHLMYLRGYMWLKLAALVFSCSFFGSAFGVFIYHRFEKKLLQRKFKKWGL